MEVTFLALIKKLAIKSLVSLDKECQLILRFQADDNILDKLNRLHKPDEMVTIIIKEEEK